MNRRLAAIIVFRLVMLAEIGDLIRLIITLAGPDEAARSLGISPRAEIITAIILVALALLAAMNAPIALAGALRRSAFVFQLGALMTGIVLALYGAYQILSAVFQHGHMQFAAVGLVYAALGALALWFARRASLVATKVET
jgi:hypothetical protein